VLRKNGIEDPQAIIEYPKMRQKESVLWEEGDQEKVENWIKAVQELIGRVKCPALEKKPICKSCSYFDFCYIHEV
jgi:CRISPR-associated exonuclease Cas4